jgi:hypothetical protein
MLLASRALPSVWDKEGKKENNKKIVRNPLTRTGICNLNRTNFLFFLV